YEKFHRVNISDQVIEEAVKLSDRYLVDRFLPDKAIDVIDEASSKLKVKTYRIPEEIVKITAQLKEIQEEKVTAVNTQNFEKAAYLRDQALLLENKLHALNEEFENDNEFSAEVDIERIRDIISDWSKVPVTQMTQEETDKYRDLDKNLKKYVIG